MLQYNWCVVNKTSSPELPIELKERIERVVKERNEKPAKLLSCPIDSLPGVEEAQLEVRRRDRNWYQQELYEWGGLCQAGLLSLQPQTSPTRM